MAPFWPKLTKIGRNELFLKIIQKISEFGDYIIGHFGPSDFVQFVLKMKIFVRTDFTNKIDYFSTWPNFYRNSPKFTKMDFSWKFPKSFQIWGTHFSSFWPLRFSSIWAENGDFCKPRSQDFSTCPYFDRNWPKLTEMKFSWKLAKKFPNLGTPFLVILAPQIFFNLAWKRTFS